MPLLQADTWRDTYSELLQKYVSIKGVDYAAWKNNESDLKSLDYVIDFISKNNPIPSTKEAKLSYYMNAYNAWVIKHVLDSYPIRSVTDLGLGFELFSEERIQVGGKKMSLNHLEKELLINQLGEARVHFGVNCAAKSCPPLAPYAFTQEEVESQLEKLSSEFISNSDVGVKLSGDSLTLSMIFNWYAEDFNPEGVVAFVNKYRNNKIPKDVKLSYFEYDWALNKSNQ